MIIDLDTKAAQMREEVIFSRVSNVGLDSDVIDQLCSMAAKTSRGRVRLCVHRDSSEEQQEMLIVHPRHAYVPPHKHLGKSESIFILRGSTDYFLFDDVGNIAEKIELGDQYSKKCFFFRLSEPTYHSMLIRSGVVVFLEITQGPFDPSDNVVAPWAPEANDHQAVDRFLKSLTNGKIY